MQTQDERKNALQKKLGKLLETRLDTDKETLEALKDLSTYLPEDMVITDLNLRYEIEKHGIEINKKFLEAFRAVKDAIEEVCDEIDDIADSVSNMKANLQSSQVLTKDLILQTNDLQNEGRKVQLQQQVAKKFIAHFQLSVEEHKILYGANRDDAITMKFFDVLDRVQVIHNDCRVLIQNNFQTLALDIMEEMTLHQEAALERLYRWTQNHCRNIDNNEIGNLVIIAMSRLQDRPVLFKYVIDEYSTARRSVLVRMFIDALTIGGHGGHSKPIESLAHDPKRYIGDMFAWLHQAIPTEKENLMLLVKKCEQNDLTDQIQIALSHIVDGICHPLKVRVETILNSERDTIILYALSNLLRFYQNIINQVVRGGNLEQCLIDLQKYSEQVYLNSLATQVKTILQGSSPQGRGLDPPQRDLVPPQSVGKLLNILKEILSVASMVEGRQSDIVKIVSCVIDPLLQSVQESASHLPTVDMAVYLLNCLYHMQSALAVYEYMDERVERLQAQSDAQIDTLTSEQASSLVANLNLGPIYTILQNNNSKIEVNLLKIFMDKFLAFLEMPEILLLPQISLLLSSNHRQLVQKRSFNVIIAIYKQMYERIQESAYHTDVASVKLKTPEEISKILLGS
ncbi:conserved oligomeric Golgi complex subunit 6 [Condylostylus longicornis]|uniref:conserved oligomeric Golgi complex subunit 6 n=1 Tax=Condylostylus longicornis TaxID=2530218 RepID=UPI00244E43C7|nr:conserved oligomeric Golgi complex subunit 6 [Condylostylus longicornis]